MPEWNRGCEVGGGCSRMERGGWAGPPRQQRGRGTIPRPPELARGHPSSLVCALQAKSSWQPPVRLPGAGGPGAHLTDHDPPGPQLSQWWGPSQREPAPYLFAGRSPGGPAPLCWVQGSCSGWCLGRLMGEVPLGGVGIGEVVVGKGAEARAREMGIT